MIITDIKKQLTAINKLIKQEADLRSSKGIDDMLGNVVQSNSKLKEIKETRTKIVDAIKELNKLSQKLEGEKI